MTTMTFTFEIPDNCSPALVQQYANEFEQKINVLKSNPKEQKRQAMTQLIQRCATFPTLEERLSHFDAAKHGGEVMTTAQLLGSELW